MTSTNVSVASTSSVVEPSPRAGRVSAIGCQHRAIACGREARHRFDRDARAGCEAELEASADDRRHLDQLVIEDGGDLLGLLEVVELAAGVAGDLRHQLAVVVDG